MKPSEYKTIAETIEVENEKLKESMDYIERHFSYNQISVQEWEIAFLWVMSAYDIVFKLDENNVYISKNIEKIYFSSIEVFYNNYVGIMGTLKHYI